MVTSSVTPGPDDGLLRIREGGEPMEHSGGGPGVEPSSPAEDGNARALDVVEVGVDAREDEASMREFMMARPHRRAMPKFLEWCDEAAVVHWLQESSELPDWQEAHRRMVAEGRRSKVRHPSPAHEAFEIPSIQRGR